MMGLLGFRPLLVLAFILGFVSLPSDSVRDEVQALLEFKKSIFEDPQSKLSDWNPQKGDPCRWTGVACSPENSVTSINLSNSCLKGFLVQQLGSISTLQELILNNNLFIGSIPSQLGMLKSLSVLDLSANQLSGPIPSDTGNLTSLNKLYLHSNKLTGSIPPELGNLMSLVELRLDSNRLSGVLPGSNHTPMYIFPNNNTGLCKLSNLRVANFSNNLLVGKIPSCLSIIPSSSFQGNCLNGKGSLQKSPQQCSSASQDSAERTKENFHEGTRKKRPQEPFWLLILEITTAIILLVITVICVVMTFKRCKSKSSLVLPQRKISFWKDETTISIDGSLLKGVSRIRREELEAACEDFSNIIESSANSVIYKGTMKQGSEIAVISLCIPDDQWTNSLELFFQSEVANLSRLNHASTARLLGYCQENEPFSRMLIFEYASNGTLYENIHYGDGNQLSWLRRMKIAIGIAQGLRYLHTELQPPFTIQELTSNTVYLTEDFTPKLVDFERWKAFLSKPKIPSSDRNMNGGCSIYRLSDPLEIQRANVQENIYSFGIILLELISGRPPYCKERGGLMECAVKHLEHPEEIEKVVEPGLENVNPDDLSVISSVVSLCLEPEPLKRPSMQIVAAMLEDGIDTSTTAALRKSPLAWAELVISS